MAAWSQSAYKSFHHHRFSQQSDGKLPGYAELLTCLDGNPRELTSAWPYGD
jgi:hypothetical protein